jgi:hypothetical protein
MKRFQIARWLIATTVACISPSVVFAQAVASAQIHGVVSDATGAFVASAQIKARQTDTGQTRESLSATDGSFVLPNLPVGPYSLEVAAPSFSNYVQSGIILQVGSNVLVNVTLQVGAVSEKLQVSANAVMVETQDTAISEVVDQRRIVDLPLNGRQATDLILLSGGASVPPGAAGRFVTSHDFPSSPGVSISGGQENGNNYLLDGGDHNDTHSNINLPFPFPDAIQEFSVETSGVSARYGVHPYAVVNVVTKSGTNQIHGSLFEFVRNGNVNARNFFAPTHDSLRRNQFGYTAGVPILKDKLFFFNGLQSTRTRTAPPTTLSYVNTQASLNGDFSALESAGCQASKRAVTLIDPASSNNLPFPNNFVSPTRFSPAALGLAKLTPVSADPCGSLLYSIPSPNDENQWVGRVDWVRSAKHSVYARYFILDWLNPSYYIDNLLTTTRAELNDRIQSLVLGDQYSFSPTVLNSFHATFGRFIVNRAAPDKMPNLNDFGARIYQAYPHFVDLSVSNHFSIGGGSNAPATFARNQFHLSDDVDIIRGRHHYVMGMEVITMQMDERNVSLANGEWTFSGQLTNDPLADFMVGRPSKLADGNYFMVDLRQRYWGAYFQDDIRLTKTLSVHFGARWEPSLPEHDLLGRGSHFSLDAFTAGQRSTVYTNAPAGLLFYGDPHIPSAYAGGSWLGIAPRVGLAWDPSGKGKQSIRASYGIFYDTPESFTDRDFGQSAPWASSVSLTAPVGGFDDPFRDYPGGSPFPGPYPAPKNSTFVLAGLYVNMPLDLHHMYTQNWNLSYQAQLGGNWLVSATYIGNGARHLRAAFERNPAVYIPGASTVANTNNRRLLSQINPKEGAYYATITNLTDGLTTSYNGLRLSAQHRFSHNFTLLSVYTWSHCMQNAETLGNRVSQGSNQYQDPNNRNADTAPCDFDLRHNFVTSIVYESPRFASRAMTELLGHWQIGTLLTYRTGFPYTPTAGVDNSLTGVGQDRPNVVGNPYVRNTNTLVWVTPSAFQANAPGTFGNAGYNSLIGPKLFGLDANVSRVFHITERFQFQLRFEFFNALNHTNFNTPVSSFNSANFGKIQSAADPRILQFAAKFSF